MIRLSHVDDQANPASGLGLVFSVPSFVERRLANRKKGSKTQRIRALFPPFLGLGLSSARVVAGPKHPSFLGP